MSVHFTRDLEKVKKQLLLLSGRVEENVARAVKAIAKRDANLAREVLDADNAIDEMEVTTEEECLKILALHQPVAVDLRFLVAVIKINNDLERIGDLAVNIGERAAFLAWKEPLDIPFDVDAMAAQVQDMLRCSLDALVNMDVAQAESVSAKDDSVDAMNREMFELVKSMARSNPENLDILLHMLSISRHLERIADLTTNIAEDVIYMATGKIIRHHTEDYVQVQDSKE